MLVVGCGTGRYVGFSVCFISTRSVVVVFRGVVVVVVVVCRVVDF